MVRVGINGFGRIGRLALRVILQKYKEKILPVAINTSGRMDASGWGHLFTYDSSYGKYSGKVKTEGNKIVVDGLKIPILGERDPGKIPWGTYQTEIVIESTGVFRKEKEVKLHLRETVKKVLLSAPPKEGNIPMFIIGVNEKQIDSQPIISCASCTTNCVAPIAKVMDEAFGIKKAFLTTIHAYTSDQQLLDGSHKDLRRARAAAANIVPTTTGAAKATAKVYPPLKGKFDGIAIRVPVALGSLTDFVFDTRKGTSKEKVNLVFKKAASENLKGILGVTHKPLVSSDIKGSSFSAIVDLSLTSVLNKNLVKVVAWYDNEWGYACRLVEEILLIGEKIKKG